MSTTPTIDPTTDEAVAAFTRQNDELAAGVRRVVPADRCFLLVTAEPMEDGRVACAGDLSPEETLAVLECVVGRLREQLT